MIRTIVFLLIASCSFAQTLPNAPSQSKTFDKKFLFSTAALFGSAVFDVEVSHAGIQRGKCVEYYGDPRSSRGQLYARMLPVDGILFGFSLLMKKSRLPIAPYVPLLMGSGRHIYAGSQWYTMGCM